MSKNEKEVKKEAVAIEPPKGVFREYFESFVVTLIMAIFGMTFVLQAVTVPTGSMQNTINIGDYLLVNKFIFAPGDGHPLPFLPQREIRRGDIIVFKFPGYPQELNIPKLEKQRAGEPYKINFVKRVIGLPGDKIEVKNNQVFVNDQPLAEHRISGDSTSDEAALTTTEVEPRQPDQKYDVYYSPEALKDLLNDNSITFGAPGKPYTVPADSYFVMGDSRNNSLDSRYWGPVHRNLIIGRAMFVYWSCDRAAADGSMLGCITNPRLERIGKLIR